MNVFDLMAKISLDTSGFDKGLDDSESKATSFASSMASKLGTASKVAVGAIGAVAGTVAGAGVALTNGTSQVAQYADAIDKSSQKLGVSAQFYQEWDAVLQHSGTSMESMGVTFKTLSKAVQNGSADQQKAFAKLGLSMEEMANLSTEEVFAKTVSALQDMEEGTERTALATQLLGRGAMELGPLLNTSAEDTQGMIDAVHELNGVMSDESVKAGARFQDSLQDMQTSFTGLKNNVMAQFLPAFADVMDGLSMIFSGQEGGAEKISAGIDNIITTIQNGLPKFVELGGQIVGSLFDALIANLPMIMKGGTELILTLITGIIDSLPQIVESMVTVITTVADSISENLPVLLPKIIEAVIAVAQCLIENLPTLIGALVEIIASLAVAIVKNIPTILKSIGKMILDILGKIKDSAKNFLEKGKNLGIDLLKGIWNGIKEKIGWLKDKAGEALEGVKDKIKGIFGIHSPSKWGAQMGDFIMQGIGNGIMEGAKNASKVMGDAMDELKDIGDMDMQSTYTVVPDVKKTESNESQLLGAIFNAMAMPEQKEHVTIIQLDGKTIAKAVDKPLQDISRQRGLVLAGGEAW